MPNTPRWDGTRSKFYEVWYFIFTDRETGDGYWIRYTLLNPLDSHPAAGGTLWFGYTCRRNPDLNLAISKTFGASEIRVAQGALDLSIGPATLREGALSGAFGAYGKRVDWDLSYRPASNPHYFFGGPLRALTQGRSSVTIPNPKIFLSGRLSVNGSTRTIRAAPGHQAHHWGTERAARWLWGHCCNFEEDEGAVVELLSAGVPGGLDLTFANLYASDCKIEASGVSDLFFNRARAGLGYWSFEAYQGPFKLLVDVQTDPRLVLKFVYTSPTYATSECWNTQIGDCLVRLYQRPSRLGRFKLCKVLRAYGCAAAEIHDVCLDNIPYPAWWAQRG